MKTLAASILALTLSTSAWAQITITDADFAQVDDTFRISTAVDPAIDYQTTGPNTTWDFSTLEAFTQTIDTIHPPDAAPGAYQFFFDNQILYPDYASDFTERGQGIDLFGQLTVENVFDFYKIDQNSYRYVGYGAQLNSIPTPVQYDDIDTVYRFPMDYGNSDSSIFSFGLGVPTIGYYGGFGDRVNEVDGWGSITTPYGTFDALRIRTVITREDSLYVDLLGFGFSLPRNTIEYRWFAQGMGVPVLTITNNLIFGTETVGSIEYPDSVREVSIFGLTENQNPAFAFELFPNPTTEHVQLRFEQPVAGFIRVFDVNGRQVYEDAPSSVISSARIDVSAWNSGTYIVQFSDSQGTFARRFVKR